MRTILALLATSSLAACSGGGPTTVGGSAVTGSGSSATPTSAHTFVSPTESKTYSAIGGVHDYQYSTDSRNVGQYNQLYAGDASTARNSAITITYDPRDAIFDVAVAAPLANYSQTKRFQDPAHRTAFGGLSEPQSSAPDLTAKTVQYLQTGSSTGTFGLDGYSAEATTFFYQKPGTGTKYVTFAGFVRNAVKITDVVVGANPAYQRYDYDRARGSFVYGERTTSNAVPRTGTGTFTGDMLASMVYNPLIDTQPDAPTYFQWISGTSTTLVDFGASTFSLALSGLVGAPHTDSFSSGVHSMLSGASFTAAGTGRIDLVNAGGFLGAINSASFVQTNGTRVALTIAGSSVDGTFYGPTANEVGGGFRIVGGRPDERIDILGVFTGK